MGIYNDKVSYGVVNNPLTDSPYVLDFDVGFNIPPPETYFMITEDGKFMLTEDGVNLMITE